MKLIVGLGNPGSRYARTRHNAGFLVLDQIAQECGASIGRKMFESEYGEAELFQQAVVFVKPQTFMNVSGRSVRHWLGFYKVPAHDLIVMHDDIDLPRGSVKMRVGGGHGGHNGIRSIIEETGERDFFRIKLGVGKPVPTENSDERVQSVADWVLSPFSEEELANLKDTMFKEAKLRLQEIFRQSQQEKP